MYCAVRENIALTEGACASEWESIRIHDILEDWGGEYIVRSIGLIVLAFI